MIMDMITESSDMYSVHGRDEDMGSCENGLSFSQTLPWMLPLLRQLLTRCMFRDFCGGELYYTRHGFPEKRGGL